MVLSQTMKICVFDDKNWDDFLMSTEMGQFQQSGMWARYKEYCGWNPHREVFGIDDQIVGGFQLLTKKTYMGNIGYISKGPLLKIEDDNYIDQTIISLIDTMRKKKLIAAVIQPPDNSILMRERFLSRDFVDIPILGVIDATLLVSVDGGKEKIEKAMTREKRRMIRQGIRSGVLVREGGRTDIPLFFEMMSSSCKRQGVRTPNPANVQELEKLWESFDSRGAIRLTFAEHGGIPLAGLLCIAFGERVTLWKKGWSGKGREVHPNDILYMDAFLWACNKGYSVCDFAGMNTDIAQATINRVQLTDRQRSSHDMFNFEYGGTPKLLPKAMIYIKNPLVRKTFRAMSTTNVYSKFYNIIKH